MVFDRPHAKLPIARLRPRAPQARRRVLVAELDRWLSARWEWVQPRTVPLLAALLGLLVTLGAVKYVSVYAYSDSMALPMRARTTATRPEPPAAHPWQCHVRSHRPTHAPVQIVVEPIKPGDPYIELTFTQDDAH